MRRIFLLLAVLWAVPAAAQIIPPLQFINVVSSGSCVSGNCATWQVPNSAPSLTAQITGTMTSMTVTFEGTADGQTWFSVQATNLSSATTATTATATGQYAIVNPGLVGFRVRCTTYASGGVNVTLTRGSASAKAGVGGGGGGAPVDATYITETANTTLTNEFALGSLASGLLFNTTTTGVPSIYTGSSTCSASSIASLDTAGVATCASAPAFSSSVGLGSLVSPYGVTTLTSPQTEGSNSFALGVTLLPPKTNGQVVTGAGSCTPGTHVATVTGVSTGGVETLPYPSTPAVTCVTGTDAIRVNVGSPQIGIASLNMYISKAGTTTPLFRCTTGTSITSTQISCTLADGSLGAQNPPSTQPTRTTVLRWQDSDERAADTFTVGPTGLQLWPTESAGSNDFTLATWASVPDRLFLTNTTNGNSRSFQAGNLYLGTSMATGGDRYHLTSGEFANGTTTLHLWCSNVAASTCDTGLTRNAAAVIEANTSVAGTLGAFKGGYQIITVKDSITAPTIASGGCTSPAVTHSNGTAAFLLTIGTSCTGVKTIVLTMPAASHFWACDANNNTSDAQQAANTIASRATSTTAVTLTNYARTTGLQADYTASDTLLVKCSGE